MNILQKIFKECFSIFMWSVLGLNPTQNPKIFRNTPENTYIAIYVFSLIFKYLSIVFTLFYYLMDVTGLTDAQSEIFSRQKKQALLKKFKRGGNRCALLCLFNVLFNDYNLKEILVNDFVSKITTISYQNLKRQLVFFENCGFFEFEHRFDNKLKKKRLKGSIPYTYITKINVVLIKEIIWFLREKNEIDKNYPEKYFFQHFLKPKHKLGEYEGLFFDVEKLKNNESEEENKDKK